LYNDALRYFDQLYIHTIVAEPHQPTEADYQALLTSITAGSVTGPDAISLLPRFSHISGADLEAHYVPQHVITFVEQNRESLQRAARDQVAGLSSTADAQPDDLGMSSKNSSFPSALESVLGSFSQVSHWCYSCWRLGVKFAA
jgi:hypothetical protein